MVAVVIVVVVVLPISVTQAFILGLISSA